MSERIYTACLVIIGNEILSGRTQDVNLNHLALRLNEWGVRLREARVIPDVEDTIIDTINKCRARYDYVFTTGGIGPTHDDITSASVAKAFAVALVKDPEAMRILSASYPAGEFTPARQKMAEVPEGAVLIENTVSAAPGYQIGNVFVLAGVPSIMRAMLDTLKNRLVGGAPVLSRTVRAALPESRVADGLGEIQGRYPQLDIGSYPFFAGGRYGTSLVLRGTNSAELDTAADEIAALVRGFGVEPELS